MRSVGLGWCFGSGPGAGEAVGVGAGLDDGAVEGEAVDDGRAEAWIGEGLRPIRARRCTKDRRGRSGRWSCSVASRRRPRPDRRNNLWSAYYDEGVYVDPTSAAGLARWDSGGNHLWRYWPPQGVAHIDTVYALNVADSAASAVCWPSFPLVEAQANGRLRVRKNPVGSPMGLRTH